MKKYFLFLFFSAMLSNTYAQISIQPVLPLAGIIQKNNLWNIAVINTASVTFDCRLELVLRDRVSGLEVLTATTGQFRLGVGAKQLNASQLMPVQYNYITAGTASRTDEFIPIGNYTACYRLTDNKSVLAEECLSFEVEPLSPPMLISPADSSLLETQPSQFTWIPPAPMNLFSRLSYEVMVTEILPGQKAEEAIQQNVAFYMEPNIPINNLTYRGMGSAFEKDKWYAWQIVARDDKSYAGKSEVWVFKIEQASIAKMIVEQAPFIKMKKNSPEKGIAPNSILKLSYINETTDSFAQVDIVDLSSSEQTKYHFTINLKSGENLIEYNLKKLRLDKNKVYEAQIINSRNEKWTMQFEIYSYEEKNKTK